MTQPTREHVAKRLAAAGIDVSKTGVNSKDISPERLSIIDSMTDSELETLGKAQKHGLLDDINFGGFGNIGPTINL